VPEPATYVYCLIQSPRKPSVRGAPAGMPGSGPARLLELDGGIWAAVADAPLDRFSGDQLEQELQDIEAVSRHAMAHASMIEFFFRSAPVIPVKLFTLFSGDDRARRHLSGSGSKVRTMFKRLRGLEEWGVRITASNRRQGPPALRAAGPASGRAYLEVKKRMKEDDGAPSGGTKREVSAALKALGKVAARSRKEDFPPPGRGRPYVAGASFLVKTGRRAAWRKRVSQLTASLAKKDHRLEVSGPWPPYHFATDARAGG
jgi:hypothetical protein